MESFPPIIQPSFKLKPSRKFPKGKLYDYAFGSKYWIINQFDSVHSPLSMRDIHKWFQPWIYCFQQNVGWTWPQNKDWHFQVSFCWMLMIFVPLDHRVGWGWFLCLTFCAEFSKFFIVFFLFFKVFIVFFLKILKSFIFCVIQVKMNLRCSQITILMACSFLNRYIKNNIIKRNIICSN